MSENAVPQQQKPGGIDWANSGPHINPPWSAAGGGGLPTSTAGSAILSIVAAAGPPAPVPAGQHVQINMEQPIKMGHGGTGFTGSGASFPAGSFLYRGTSSTIIANTGTDFYFDSISSLFYYNRNVGFNLGGLVPAYSVSAGTPLGIYAPIGSLPNQFYCYQYFVNTLAVLGGSNGYIYDGVGTHEEIYQLKVNFGDGIVDTPRFERIAAGLSNAGGKMIDRIGMGSNPSEAWDWTFYRVNADDTNQRLTLKPIERSFLGENNIAFYQNGVTAFEAQTWWKKYLLAPFSLASGVTHTFTTAELGLLEQGSGTASSKVTEVLTNFSVPMTGKYHIEMQVTLGVSALAANTHGGLYLDILKGVGPAVVQAEFATPFFTDGSTDISASVVVDVSCNQGDAISFQVNQANTPATAINVTDAHFSIRRVL